MPVARAKAEKELADTVHFSNTRAETAPRLESLFMAKPKVVQVDGWGLRSALLEVAPASDGGVKLRVVKHAFFELKAPIEQQRGRLKVRWGRSRAIVPARYSGNKRNESCPSCEFSCRPLEFESLPVHESITN